MFALQHLDLTFPTPAENLACDEALLDGCDADHGPAILRFWEPDRPFVVVGYANRVRDEVNVEACRTGQIQVFRRCSGGGTVLQGPGCLNYTLVLPLAADARLQSISGTNRFVMERHRETFAGLLCREVLVQGFTDLTVGPLKFSGNAQRRTRRAVLFHGAFLLDLDLALMDKLLRLPTRQPDYRQGRSHESFVTNLGLPAALVKDALRRCWGADTLFRAIPTAQIEALARTKYSQDAWNLRW